MDEQGIVTTSVTVGIDVDLTHMINELLSGYMVLYKDPKFFGCIIIAFAAAYVVHIVLRAYCHNMRKVTMMLCIFTVHMGVGALAAHRFMSHVPDVEFYKYFTGINSIILYGALVWATTRLFKFPMIARWLTLRETKVKLVDNKTTIEFGDTITFLKK
jgi:hypothetical protein